MSCIKTGTWVWFANYGYRACCDVYAVGDCYIFRWNRNSIEYKDPNPNEDWEVGLIDDSDVWFYRDDLQIAVIPSRLVCPGNM